MNPADLIPYITGAGGALIVLAYFNWKQGKEKEEFLSIIREKDKDLILLTKETVASITTLSGLNQANQKWQESVTKQLETIKENMP